MQDAIHNSSPLPVRKQDKDLNYKRSHQVVCRDVGHPWTIQWSKHVWLMKRHWRTRSLHWTIASSSTGVYKINTFDAACADLLSEYTSTFERRWDTVRKLYFAYTWAHHRRHSPSASINKQQGRKDAAWVNLAAFYKAHEYYYWTITIILLLNHNYNTTTEL